MKMWRSVVSVLIGAALTTALVEAQDTEPTEAAFIFSLPEPTGPFAVGVTSRHWIDQAREESITVNDPDDQREVLVDFWYPSTVENGAVAAPYFPYPEAQVNGLNEILRSYNYSPLLQVQDFAGQASHSYQNPAVAPQEATYPVLIFSHGWGGFPHVYTSILQEVASHGYVVAAINHPYVASTTTFPDGRVVLGRFDLDPDMLAAIMSDDHQFVLNQLETLNANDPEDLFTGRLNLQQVGVFGHSLGGLAATSTLLADNRFGAGMSIDGGLALSVRNEGIDQPFMYMAARGGELGAFAFRNFRGSVTTIRVATFEHNNFTDGALFSVPFLLVRPTEGDRSPVVTDAYILAFFDHTLRGEPAPLLEGASPDFPEVSIVTIRP